MKHEVKQLAEATESQKLKSLIESHVREVVFNEESKHITIYLDNQHNLRELEDNFEKNLNSALEKIYDPESTWELKLLNSSHGSDREKGIPRSIH